MGGIKIPGLHNKISSCKVGAVKRDNTVKDDTKSVLESFENYYRTIGTEQEVPKCPPKHPMNNVLTLLLNIVNI